MRADRQPSGAGTSPFREEDRIHEREGELTGFVAWDRIYDLHWGFNGVQIADLYVVPERRGYGLALPLLVAICAEARAGGATFLRGASYDRSSATGRFYERLAVGLARPSARALAGPSGIWRICTSVAPCDAAFATAARVELRGLTESPAPTTPFRNPQLQRAIRRTALSSKGPCGRQYLHQVRADSAGHQPGRRFRAKLIAVTVQQHRDGARSGQEVDGAHLRARAQSTAPHHAQMQEDALPRPRLDTGPVYTYYVYGEPHNFIG